MATPKHDWLKVREEYISGGDPTTLDVLGKKYGIPESTIRKRSMREDWRVLREKFRLQTREETVKRLAKREAGIRERHIRLGYALIAKAAERLQRLQANELDATETRLWLQAGTEIQRKAAGIADEVALRHEIDVTRLTTEQLERLRDGEDPERVIDVGE